MPDPCRLWTEPDAFFADGGSILPVPRAFLGGSRLQRDLLARGCHGRLHRREGSEEIDREAGDDPVCKFSVPVRREEDALFLSRGAVPAPRLRRDGPPAGEVITERTGGPSAGRWHPEGTA